jgi:4-amino-4-deoxy-L-arabinose transferase-like glycosyltransferase
MLLLANPGVFIFGIPLYLSLIAVGIIKKLREDYVLFTASLSVALILGLATVAQTKLAWYILPVYPFAAILLGKITLHIRLKNPQEEE